MIVERNALEKTRRIAEAIHTIEDGMERNCGCRHQNWAVPRTTVQGTL
jgi:hypothetical protein